MVKMRQIFADKLASAGGIVIAIALRLLDIVDANTYVVSRRVLVGLDRRQASRVSRHHGWTNYCLA